MMMVRTSLSRILEDIYIYINQLYLVLRIAYSKDCNIMYSSSLYQWRNTSEIMMTLTSRSFNDKSTVNY